MMHGAWLVLFVLLWAVVVVLAVMVLGLSARLTSLQMAVGLATGGAPRLQLPSRGMVLPPTDRRHELVAQPAGDGLLVLLFLSPTCGPCLELAKRLAAAEPEECVLALQGTKLGVVTDDVESRVFAAGGAISHVIPDGDSAIARDLGIGVTPFAMVVDPEGVIQETGSPGSLADVALMVERGLASSRPEHEKDREPAGAELDIALYGPQEDALSNTMSSPH